MAGQDGRSFEDRQVDGEGVGGGGRGPGEGTLTCVHVYVRTCVYVCMFYVHARAYECMYVCVCTCVCVCTFMYSISHTGTTATIPLGALNVGYSAGASSPTLGSPVQPVQQVTRGLELGEAGVIAGVSGWTSGGVALPGALCENSSDSCSMAPVTPQRAPVQSPGEC